MLKIRVIPCLLLKNRGLVKTVRFSEPKYVGDPINAVKIFNDKEVDELIFLDIGATLENRKPDFKLISDLASECFMPFAYGGGITTLDEAKEIIRLGVEKIVINSSALKNPNLIKEIAGCLGSQSLVLGVDVKLTNGTYQVFTHSGKKPWAIDLLEHIEKMVEYGIGEIFINSIDRDGTMEGYDLALIEKVSKAVKVPVIASGGAGKPEHFRSAVKSGTSAVAAGSLFVFYGKFRSVLINYPSPEEISKILE